MVAESWNDGLLLDGRCGRLGVHYWLLLLVLLGRVILYWTGWLLCVGIEVRLVKSCLRRRCIESCRHWRIGSREGCRRCWRGGACAPRGPLLPLGPLRPLLLSAVVRAAPAPTPAASSTSALQRGFPRRVIVIPCALVWFFCLGWWLCRHGCFFPPTGRAFGLVVGDSILDRCRRGHWYGCGLRSWPSVGWVRRPCVGTSWLPPGAKS